MKNPYNPSSANTIMQNKSVKAYNQTLLSFSKK